jgi:hypothetical protein
MEFHPWALAGSLGAVHLASLPSLGGAVPGALIQVISTPAVHHALCAEVTDSPTGPTAHSCHMPSRAVLLPYLLVTKGFLPGRWVKNMAVD